MSDKTPKTKLDLIHDSEKLVAIVRKECQTPQYDKKKVQARLNCNGHQAGVLISLAQIADAQAATPPAGKAAKA